MATQSAALHGAHARHGSSNSTTMSLPPLPASPTLTNPDMILPDYDYDRADSPENRSHSPLTVWKNTQASGLDFHLPRQNNFNTAPITPTTPIIYGNGTMLSDIGEVTEAESTIGPGSRRASSRYSVQTEQGTVLQPAATIVQGAIKRRSQIAMRRSSIDSTSTITTQDQRGHFADFDEAASVGDSSFHGDDEESMASSYIDDSYVHMQRAAMKQAAQETDQFSTNSIGQRAELILANAKRRLTTMEGNLSKARTSLEYSSVSDGSTPSPPMVRPATSLHESVHSRNGSDNSMRGPSQPALHTRRSASALGAAGGYRQPGSSRNVNTASNGSSSAVHMISHHPLDTTLQPLSEDDDDNASLSESRRSSTQPSGLSSPSLYSETGMPRSASVAQVRDIQDQMNGLKGKISSLKKQARADSMKRRSLQSLRTPSPFTHAVWEQVMVEPRSIATPDIPEEDPTAKATGVPAGVPRTAADEIEIDLTEDARSVIGPSDRADEEVSPRASPTYLDEPVSPTASQRGLAIGGGDEDDLRTENGDANEERGQEDEYEDGMNDYESVSDGEGSTYHDTFQEPVSHEDREDAFDYEHFFLHSAMGSLTRQRMGQRGSRGSVSSDDSVETTRGPSSARRASLDTMSSADTFETATEGMRSRGSTSQEIDRDDGNSYDELEGLSEEERNSYGFGHSHLENRPRTNSVLHRPIIPDQAANLHRPSISSFDSTGTNRSFPLVSKARLNGGMLTPGASPDLQQISDLVMNESASVRTKDGYSASIQMLSTEDKSLVEGLVASLGRCVLNLGEASQTGTGSYAYRQRLEAARRILEGSDDDETSSY